ncbi:unnamed protein product, partial [Symbiodinium sp. CCMP2456]
MEEWHDRAVRCALYFDEVQAGNILAPLPSKKAGFFYLGFPDFGVAWRNSPRAWVTLGMLPYLDHQNVPGGYTAYLHLLLEELDLARNAFPVARGIKISLFLAMYIADHDAQKIVFDNTGSAGLAPCLFCANICKLDADLAGRDADGLLRDITEDNVRRFVRKQDEDWFKLVDDLHRDVCSMRLTKKAVKQRSQCLGINYRPDSGHLFQARYRHLLPPSYCFNDYLHAYFQGGCAAVETTRLVERVLSRTLLNLEDVAEMARMNWKAARHVTSAGPQGRADFFHERRFRSCYVGSGGEQIQMMPLLLFTLCRLLLPRGELQQELECYSLLVQITHCYRWLHHTEKISNTSRLQLLATESAHQRKALLVYGKARHRDFTAEIGDRMDAFAKQGLASESPAKTMLTASRDFPAGSSVKAAAQAVAFDMLACYSTWQRSGRLQIHTATVLREFLQPRWWME